MNLIQPPTLRICVVENHADTRHMLSVLLAQQGHEVAAADSYAAAVALFEKQTFDLLISDIGLPDRDGWELLRTLDESQQRSLFAIAISGYGTRADQEKSLAAGYRAHLVKPVTFATLTPLLQQALQHAHHIDDLKTSSSA